MSAIYFAAFLTNQKENVLQYLTEKIIVSMEKFMLPKKMLAIIVFCKAQQPEPVYVYKRHALRKKKHVAMEVSY